jgi:hypothetical protein
MALCQYYLSVRYRFSQSFSNWRSVAPVGTVVGYLRRYRRWNGTDGLTFEQQREVVREVARERTYGRCGRFELKEEMDGEASGWPVLCKAIRMAEDNAERNLLVVIPTLDGVQFNLSFLELLVGDNWPVYVCSGWRSPKVFGRNTNYARRAESMGWLLSIPDEADDFAQMVYRVGQRNYALHASIVAGLKEAAARGMRLGSHRRGSHRFTTKDRRKGGQATARNRRRAANDAYADWVPGICRWRANGESLQMIAMRLADKGALTPNGRGIGLMLVHRILKRALARQNTSEF